VNVDTTTNDEYIVFLIVQQLIQFSTVVIFFSCLVMQEVIVSTISGSTNIIEGSKRAIVLLPRVIRLHIKNAFYSPKSNRNLLSFKDIRLKGYHIKTNNEGDIEYLYIT